MLLKEFYLNSYIKGLWNQVQVHVKYVNSIINCEDFACRFGLNLRLLPNYLINESIVGINLQGV